MSPSSCSLYLDMGDKQAERYMVEVKEVCERAGLDPDLFVVLPGPFINHQAQFVHHKSWVRHGLRVPRRPREGFRAAVAVIEGTTGKDPTNRGAVPLRVLRDLEQLR